MPNTSISAFNPSSATGTSHGSSDHGFGHNLTAVKDGSEVLTIPTELIIPGRYSCRKYFDPQSLDELARSIAEQNQLEPATVRKLSDGTYELVICERRYRACQQLGISIRAQLITVSDDHTLRMMAFVENVQRSSLTLIRFVAERLAEADRGDQVRLAEELGVDRTWVSQRVRVNTDLIPEAHKALISSDITLRVAVHLARRPPEEQEKILPKIKGEKQNAALAIIKNRNVNKPETVHSSGGAARAAITAAKELKKVLRGVRIKMGSEVLYPDDLVVHNKQLLQRLAGLMAELAIELPEQRDLILTRLHTLSVDGDGDEGEDQFYE